MRREVVFQSGRELNKGSTNYFSYPANGKYAVVSIPFSQGDVAIIEIGAALIPNPDGFSNENFRSLFAVRSEIEGEQINNNDKGRKWKVIAKEGLPARFIDPRVEGDALVGARPLLVVRPAMRFHGQVRRDFARRFRG